MKIRTSSHDACCRASYDCYCQHTIAFGCSCFSYYHVWLFAFLQDHEVSAAFDFDGRFFFATETRFARSGDFGDLELANPKCKDLHSVEIIPVVMVPNTSTVRITMKSTQAID